MAGVVLVRAPSQRILCGLPLRFYRQVLRGHGFRQRRVPAVEIVMVLYGRARFGNLRAVILPNGLYFRAAVRIEVDFVLVGSPFRLERPVLRDGQNQRESNRLVLFVPAVERIARFGRRSRRGNFYVQRVVFNGFHRSSAVAVKGDGIFRGLLELGAQRDYAVVLKRPVLKDELLAGAVQIVVRVPPADEYLSLRRVRRVCDNDSLA